MICGWMNLQNPWNRWWTKALKRQGFWYEGGGGACGLGCPRTYPGRGYWGVTVLGNLFRRKDSVLNLSKVVAQSLSHVWIFALQPIRLSCLLLPPRACSNSCPSSRWCHPTISSSVIPFSSCLQSFPASGSFPMRKDWLFAWGGQSIGASASASILPMNTQGWFPLGLTGLISLLSKGFLRVFFSTTVRKHKFFSFQPSSWSNSHIHTWLLE